MRPPRHGYRHTPAPVAPRDGDGSHLRHVPTPVAPPARMSPPVRHTPTLVTLGGPADGMHRRTSVEVAHGASDGDRMARRTLRHSPDLGRDLAGTAQHGGPSSVRYKGWRLALSGPVGARARRPWPYRWQAPAHRHRHPVRTAGMEASFLEEAGSSCASALGGRQSGLGCDPYPRRREGDERVLEGQHARVFDMSHARVTLTPVGPNRALGLAASMTG